jgi:hypothetical protein
MLMPRVTTRSCSVDFGMPVARAHSANVRQMLFNS